MPSCVWFWHCAASCMGVQWLALRRMDASPDVCVRACVHAVRRLTLAMSPDRFKLCRQPLVACVRLEAALDIRCRRREDVVEWSGCRLDSAVLKGAATSCRGRLADVSGPFGVTVQDDYGLCIVVGRTAHRPVVAFVGNLKPSPSLRIFSRIRPKPSAYKILRTVTTLIAFYVHMQAMQWTAIRYSHL